VTSAAQYCIAHGRSSPATWCVLPQTHGWDLIAGCNGALVGFVSITASTNVVEPWAAIICGLVGGWIFDAVCALFLKLRIDDPLSAAPMHFFCGMWGVFFVGLLAKAEYICDSYALPGCTASSYDADGNRLANYYKPPHGLFYGGGGRLLACQVRG
jgi:Amt family ammonium transporter